jgi:hypothetical protein
MRKMKFGILLVFAVLALVSVASAALPASVTATITHPGPASYFDVDVTSGGNFDLPNANDYLGWCGSSELVGIGPGNVFTPYDSRGTLPSGINTVQWNQVNYVINHKGTANAATIQALIWYYDGGIIPWGTVEVAKFNALKADADANPAYVPSVPGEKYAVILWKTTGVQPVFIEVPIPSIPTPEFPTLALPVAMLIGVVGAVQYVRARKE